LVRKVRRGVVQKQGLRDNNTYGMRPDVCDDQRALTATIEPHTWEAYHAIPPRVIDLHVSHILAMLSDRRSRLPVAVRYD